MIIIMIIIIIIIIIIIKNMINTEVEIMIYIYLLYYFKELTSLFQRYVLLLMLNDIMIITLLELLQFIDPFVLWIHGTPGQCFIITKFIINKRMDAQKLTSNFL